MKKSKIIRSKTPRDLALKLGLSPFDAIEWGLRSAITGQIIISAQESDLTVTEISKNAGTSRSRVTRILKNDTQGISLDVLVRVLGALSVKMEVRFKKAA